MGQRLGEAIGIEWTLDSGVTSGMNVVFAQTVNRPSTAASSTGGR
ncbi:MAG: hypothetical protein ABW173_03035 [Sphingomonas sp.]